MKYRRYRRKRYSRKRYSRRRYSRKRYSVLKRQRPRTEVKVWDASINGKGIYADVGTSGTLQQHVFSDILGNIGQGTNAYNRLGNRIYVKAIQIRCQYWTCGFTWKVSGINYTETVNTALLRILVHDGGSAPNAYFFAGTSAGNKVGAPLNRKNYNVFYDKVHRLQGGVGNISGSISTSASVSTGDIRQHNFTIPVNRNITYNQSDAGVSTDVKDCNGIYTIGAVCTIPNASSYPLDTQNTVYATPVCTNWSIRVYFTDA